MFASRGSLSATMVSTARTWSAISVHVPLSCALSRVKTTSSHSSWPSTLRLGPFKAIHCTVRCNASLMVFKAVGHVVCCGPHVAIVRV